VKIIVVSRDGSSVPIAHQFLKEGNEVRLFVVKTEYRKDIFDGIIDKIQALKDAKGWAEWAYFGENKLVDEWKEVMTWGIPIYGGSEAGQKLEKDRPGAQELAKSFGLKVPRSHEAKTVEEVIEFLSKEKGPWVLKFVGGNCDSWDVLLGEYEDNSDLIRFARRTGKKSGKKWDAIEVDEFIPGLEVGCAAYFDGEKFAPGIEINFQNKRIAAGEGGHGVGYLTGEMGTTIRYVTESNKFFKKVLAPLAKHLKKIGYRGEIDVGTIIAENGDIYFVEFTPRTGYPDCVIRLPLQVTPLSELFLAVASGNVTENEVRGGWSVGVVMVTPGFPVTKWADDASMALPVERYEENKDNCFLFGVKKGEDGIEVCSASDGYPLVVADRGPTLESAIRRVYWRLNRSNPDHVSVPQGQYRDDIGRRVVENREEIIAFDVMTEEEWDAA
jgi:phosphoribosylamine--glycine ligase